MNLSRKRKKELEKLQKQAGNLWEAQQVLVGEAATV
ncbi:MAG: DNA helicase, partial [Microbacterium sp.]